MGPAAAAAAAADLQAVHETVLKLVRELEGGKPVHIAKLSFAYAKQAGHSVKKDHKPGMRHLIATQLADKLLLQGENNDTFVRVYTPIAAALHWVRSTVREKGPILLSMIGRLYHEQHGVDFKEVCPMGLTKFLKQQLDGELSVQQLKGTESLVDVKDRGHPTSVASLPKQLAKREEKREKAGKGAQKKSAAAETVRCELAERVSEAPSVVPYGAEDKILVLGDGDFSFSHAVVSSFKPELARKLVATVFDSSKERHAKYGLPSHSHLRAVQKAHAQARHDIDATALDPDVLGDNFDFVVFNFPHVGNDTGLETSIQENIELVRAFLANVCPLLSTTGEVHMTLLNRFPYTAWKVTELAPKELQYVTAVPFNDAVYKEYSHKATTQTERDTRTRLEQSVTHVWRPRQAVHAELLHPTPLTTKQQKRQHQAAVAAAAAAAAAADSQSDAEGGSGDEGARTGAAAAAALAVMPRRVQRADKEAMTMEEEGGAKRKEKKKKKKVPKDQATGHKQAEVKKISKEGVATEGAAALEERKFKKRLRGPKPRGDERLAMRKAARTSH